MILGLGNPGEQYAGTRHNAGMMLLDALASKHDSEYGWRKFYGILVFKAGDLLLVKSANYFMNESGNVVRDVMRLDEVKNQSPEWVLAHDDLDIKLGEYKIQMGIGPKEHHGVNSVEQALGTKEFQRVRIGVDNRFEPIPGDQYVLQRFEKEEREKLDEVIDRMVISGSI